MKTKRSIVCSFVLSFAALVACGSPVPTVTPTPTPTSVPPMPTAVPLRSTPEPTPNLPPSSSAILTLTAPHTQASAPHILPQATIRVGNLDRTYLYYIPANLPLNAPLLFAFHGSTQNAETIRLYTGYEFENLADQNGFTVVYPNGYQSSWNDCRKGSPLVAKTQNIDDLGFVRALIAQFQTEHGINPARVFAMGYSNGGHLAYRLAVELPDEINAIAAVAANYSAEDNSDCGTLGKPIPVMIMNGTGDSLNPYNGGLGVYGARVRSAQATAEFFAKLNGQTNTPKTTRLPHQDPSDPTSVDRTVWNDQGKPEVVLVTINEGGHVVPQSKYTASSGLGRTTKDLDGPAEIWDFFSRQRPLK